MRFMMLMIPAAPTAARDENWTPSAEAVGAMTKFNQDMIRAGAMLACDGLHPPSKAARVSFGHGAPTITDGTLANAKDIVGGYWMIQAKSKAEAVEWARRCPAAPGDVIEIRQVVELSDFPDDVRRAVATTGT